MKRLNKDRVENTRRHNKTNFKLRRRIIRSNRKRKADEIERVEQKRYCPGIAKVICKCWKIDILFQNFICGICIEGVHDLGFSRQLADFLRNFKAFHVSKGFTLFSKGQTSRFLN